MKKVIALILAVVLIISCCVFSANAQSAKITEKMQTALDNSTPDDIITAAVWLVGFTETVMDMPGFPDYTQSKAELEAVLLEQQERLYPEVFGGLDAEPLYRGAGSLVVVRLKAADIPTVADNSSVKLVDLWTYAPTDEKEASQEAIDRKIGYGSSDILLEMIDESDPEMYIDEIVISFKGFPETADDMPDADFYQRRRELGFLDAAKMSFLRPIVFSGIDADLSDTSMNYLFGSFKAKDIRTIASYKVVNYIEYWGNTVVDPEVGTGFYKDRFDEFYPQSGIEKYEELYYHKDKDGEVDWALIKVKSGCEVQVQDWEIEEIVGNRIVIKGDREYPFANGYGIYDVKEDKFVSVITDKIGVVADYEGLGRAYDEYGEGRLIGDLDQDDELNIIDATIIQRCDVRMRDWPEDDMIVWNEDEPAETGFAECPDQTYYSDFNRDGERDVIDATMLQRYTIGIEQNKYEPTVRLRILNENGKCCAQTTSSNFRGAVEYNYKIEGVFHAGSSFGDDLGIFNAYDPVEDCEPGLFFCTTGYIDSDRVEIPLSSLTYGESFTLSVTAKDKTGRTASCSMTFKNTD